MELEDDNAGQEGGVDIDRLRSTYDKQVSELATKLEESEAKTAELQKSSVTAQLVAEYGQYGVTTEQLEEHPDLDAMAKFAVSAKVSSLEERLAAATSGEKKPEEKKGEGNKDEKKDDDDSHPGNSGESDHSSNDLSKMTPLGLLSRGFERR